MFIKYKDISCKFIFKNYDCYGECAGNLSKIYEVSLKSIRRRFTISGRDWEGLILR